MNYESEKVLERTLSEYVRYRGGKAIKMIPVEKGLPDHAFFLPLATVLLVEFKSKNKKSTKIQLRQHKKFRDLGYRVFTVNDEISYSLVKQFIDYVFDKSKIDGIQPEGLSDYSSTVDA